MRGMSFNRFAVYLGIAVIVTFFTVPLIWLFVTPFNPMPSLSISIRGFTLEHFRKVFENKTAVLAFKNSIVISVGTVLVVTFSSLLAAYVVSRYDFKGKNVLLYVLILFSSVVTGAAAMVPLFMLNLRLGLLDSYMGVILTLSGGLLPTSIFILKDFIDSIPRTYEEAALVDGSTPFQVMTRIFFPLSSKGVIVISMLVFVSSWSNFLIPFVLIRSPRLYPISIAIYSFFTEVGVPDIGLISAYSLLYTIPVVVIYVFIERKFGFSFYGGIKG